MLQNAIAFRNVDVCLPDITSRTAETQMRLINVRCKALNKDWSYLFLDVFMDCSGLLVSTFPTFSSLLALADPVSPSSVSLSEGKRCMKAGRLLGEHRA